MSWPIHPFIAAQIIAYAKGQEALRDQSTEKQERERLYLQKLHLAKQQQNQSITMRPSKGLMA